MPPFNTTMADKLKAALQTGVLVSLKKPRRKRKLNLPPWEPTICTADGGWGRAGTPCPKCSRIL